MDQNSLHNLLDDLAKQEIPDTMNLWNDIEKRLPMAQKLPAARPALRFSTTVLTLIFALALVTGAYAVYQSQFVNVDPGIEGARTENLITPLELTQSHPEDDVNLTLLWGYADGNRIAVGWEVDYSHDYLQPGILTVQLFDAEGNLFDYADFGYSLYGSGSGGSQRASFNRATSWDATAITDDTESLDLTVVVRMVGYSNTGFSTPMGGVDSGSAGSPEATEEPERERVTPHKFSFNITLPFIPVVEAAEEPVTVTAADIPITIRDIRYAPSMTLGKVCFRAGDLPPYHLLILPSIPSFQSLNIEYPPDFSDDWTTECYTMTLLGVTADEDGVLRVHIVRLTHFLFDVPDDRWEAFQAALAESGIPVEIEREPRGYTTSIPSEGVEPTLEQWLMLDEMMANYLHDSIPGPWVFEIPLK
ncbi:MAG: DUF4179 domain-containing protein [Anaerolineae bacterium]|jgi:hypothetical protein|nr:DUF4179 domain-containing protein [Anaerolineae bacterium]